MKLLLLCGLALIGIACEAPASVDSITSAYQFAIEPCMTTGSGYVAPWVIVGPVDGSHTVVKIVATYDSTQSLRAYTLTARQLTWPSYAENSSSVCWDRFPSQVSESWVPGPFTPPGTSGYYVGTYLLTRQIDLFGYGGAVNNQPWNPSPWVVYKAQIWSGSAWVEHSWKLSAGDVYHWVQNY